MALARLALALLLASAPARAQEPDRTTGTTSAITFEVTEASIPELQAAMASGRVTAVDLVDAYLARIAAYDQHGPALNSMIRLNPNALMRAAALDAERATGSIRGPLHGIPVILKDNYDTADMPTTGASIALAGLVPPDDAFQVRRLREAGAIVLGKSNLHELAAGITTISSLGGQTLNPYDPGRYPGGSSGGTGASIAASFAAIGWGSDTCGSIRIPASQNNLIGLRPTKGLSSIDGIIPLSHSQDVGGPLARTAMDLAIGLDAVVGQDPADPATRVLDGRSLPRFVETLDSAALGGARLGVLEALFGDATEDRAMGRVVRAAIEQMTEAGAEVVDIEIAGLDSLLQGTSLIAHEFKWDLIDYLAATPGAPVTGLGDILDRGLHHVALEGTFRRRSASESRDTTAYREALAKRDVLRTAVIETMEAEGLDGLVYPTMRRPAARLGDPQRGSNCQLSAATRLPALSLPVGFTSGGLPVGVEMLGLPFSDAHLLAMGYAFEQRAQVRRAPPHTPPLVGVNQPAPLVFDVTATGPGATANVGFIFDSATGVLSYYIDLSGVPAEEVHGVTLHQAADGEVGGVIHRLSGPGVMTGSGSVALGASQREALLDGRLYVGVYTKDHPAGAARGWVATPAVVLRPDPPETPLAAALLASPRTQTALLLASDFPLCV